MINNKTSKYIKLLLTVIMVKTKVIYKYTVKLIINKNDDGKGNNTI